MREPLKVYPYFTHPNKPLSNEASSLISNFSSGKMNENILSPSMTTEKSLAVTMTTSKPLPSSSAPSSLKLLPKKFSPFSVDSLLSHKEKQAACEQTSEDDSLQDPIDLKNSEDRKLGKLSEKLGSNLTALASSLPQDLRSTRISQDSLEFGSHLSVAKFLLNNNLHDRPSSDSISRLHSSNLESDQKLKENFNSKLSNQRDPIELQKCLRNQEHGNMNIENGSSNENDIDVCGDEADMEDEDHEYHEDINGIKSENNYQDMMSDDEASAEEDNEDNDFVKTEDIEDEKLEIDRQLHYPTSDHKLKSSSDLSPKQNPLLSPRFPLGFPITSSSPNPFSPPSPSSGIAGSTLPRPTPSLPWLPQLRSPLQLPGFIGSKLKSIIRYSITEFKIISQSFYVYK